METIQHLGFYFLSAVIVAVTVGLLSSCDPDVQLRNYEDTPKVAEHILGMTKDDAMKYLEKQGFKFGSKMENSDEYVFSKDPELSAFSYEASIMFAFGTFTSDTIRYVEAMHRMRTENDARALYWKWSHYTAEFTLPKPSQWNGIVRSAKDVPTYPYPQVDSKYFQDRAEFWAHYSQVDTLLDSAHEHYKNEGENVAPKEVEIWVDMNNGGSIEVSYTTQNFIARWI